VDELQSNEPGCAVFIAGTKVDLVKEGVRPRAVSQDEVRAFAQELSIDPARIVDTSAKTGEGIQELFDRVGAMYDGAAAAPQPGVVDISGPAHPRRSGSGGSGCCGGGGGGGGGGGSK
jgi:hypothetical protein